MCVVSATTFVLTYDDGSGLVAKSCLNLVTPWTVACQAPLPVGFSWKEYWSGLPYPPPGDLPGPGIKPRSLMSPVLMSRFSTTSTTWEAHPHHIDGETEAQGG